MIFLHKFLQFSDFLSSKIVSNTCLKLWEVYALMCIHMQYTQYMYTHKQKHAVGVKGVSGKCICNRHSSCAPRGLHLVQSGNKSLYTLIHAPAKFTCCWSQWAREKMGLAHKSKEDSPYWAHEAFSNKNLRFIFCNHCNCRFSKHSPAFAHPWFLGS